MAGQALLVIDMLVDFVSEGGALYVGPAGRKVVEPIREKLAWARSTGVPVIFICDQHLPGDAEFNMFPPHCLKGSAGAEVIPELSPQSGELIIPKRRYSGFFGTDLDLTLRELGVGEVLLVGVCTNICVLYTCADARMLNYGVTVYRDCVSSFDERAHEFALQEMEKTLGAKVG